MRGASRRICSAVSNITPAGAALNIGLVGLAAWQVLQRSWMTLCTWLKVSAFELTTATAAAGVLLGPVTKARQIMPRAATGMVQANWLLLWRGFGGGGSHK